MPIDPNPLVWADYDPITLVGDPSTTSSAANLNRITAEVASEVEERIARARVLTLAADAAAYAPISTVSATDANVATRVTAPLTKAALDAAYAAIGSAAIGGLQTLPVIEGLSAIFFGDSWTANDVNNTAGGRWPLRVARRTGMVVSNRAFSGYCAADIAREAIATTAPANPVAPTTSGVIINAGNLNDLRLTDNALTRASNLYALRAFVAAAQAFSRTESSTITSKSSASHWQSNSLPGIVSADECLGLTSAVFSTAYSGIWLDVPVPTAGDYVILCLGTDGSSIRGTRITATQGGVNVATSTDGAHQPTGSGYPSNTAYGNMGILVRGLSAGTLRLTFDAQGLTSAQGWFDALIPVNRVDPPAIILTKPPLPINATWAKPALLAAINANVDTIAAEFPEAVTVCDMSIGWNAATMVGSDGLHPNDLGEAHIASRYMATLATIAARPGVHRR